VTPVGRAHVLQPLDGVGLVAGDDGGVRGEDDLLADGGERVVVGGPLRHPLADELEPGQQRVALVEVEEVDLDAERAEGADAADAEDDLLRHALLAEPPVELAGHPGGGVAGEVGVEEVERDVPERLRLPDLAADVLPGDLDRHLHPRVLQEVVVVPVLEHVVRLPEGVHGLVPVPLLPLDPEGDHGVPAVVGGAEGVAGEDAEASGVGLHAVVEAVLHAEVGDAGGRGHGQRGGGVGVGGKGRM